MEIPKDFDYKLKDLSDGLLGLDVSLRQAAIVMNTCVDCPKYVDIARSAIMEAVDSGYSRDDAYSLVMNTLYDISRIKRDWRL